MLGIWWLWSPRKISCRTFHFVPDFRSAIVWLISPLLRQLLYISWYSAFYSKIICVVDDAILRGWGCARCLPKIWCGFGALPAPGSAEILATPGHCGTEESPEIWSYSSSAELTCNTQTEHRCCTLSCRQVTAQSCFHVSGLESPHSPY